MNLVVTGATGYIGSHVLSHAIQNRHQVVAASRKHPGVPVSSWLPYELTSTEEFILPTDTNAIIHLAANTDSTAIAADINEAEFLAAQSLILAAERVAAKFVYISSQTARQDAPTSYGRLKWKIEQEVLAAGGWVVRPGQVYGGSEEGLFDILVKTVRRFPILPAFLPVPKVQPIHVDELAEGLMRIIEDQDISPGVYCLASPKPVSFTQFLSAIAKNRVRLKRWFVPVPVFLVRFISAIIGDRLRIRSRIERLYSLIDLSLMDTADDLNRLGLSLRSLSAGMHPSGNDNRRRLLREGNAFINYLLKEPPNSSLLRRYVRAVEKVRGGRPLDLPENFYRLPMLLVLLDKQTNCLSHQAVEFAWRLDTAMVLAEATSQGAAPFLGIGHKTGLLISLYWMSRALLGELFWRTFGLIYSPILRIWFHQRKLL